VCLLSDGEAVGVFCHDVFRVRSFVTGVLQSRAALGTIFFFRF
jgi:hypothetical protein